MATAVGHDDDGERVVRASIDRSVGLNGSFAELPLFESLPDEIFRNLVASSTSHRLERQTLVFCEGERLDHLYVVLSGSFKLVRHSETGKELIVALARTGDIFGALSESIESASLSQALEESVLLSIPHAVIRRTVSRHAPFALTLMQLSEARSRSFER